MAEYDKDGALLQQERGDAMDESLRNDAIVAEVHEESKQKICDYCGEPATSYFGESGDLLIRHCMDCYEQAEAEYEESRATDGEDF